MSKTVLSRQKMILPFVEGEPQFDNFNDSLKQEIVNNSEFRRYEAGSYVFSEGDQPDGGFIVASGRVLMQKATFRGKTVVTELLGSNDCFGTITAIQGRPYPMSALAIRESVVFHMHQSLLEKIKDTAPHYPSILLEICTNRLTNAHSLIAKLSDASTETRVATAILVIASKFGKLENGYPKIDFTRDEISGIASTTVETCIRITRSLEERGILKLPAPKQIEILDIEALRKICEPATLQSRA